MLAIGAIASFVAPAGAQTAGISTAPELQEIVVTGSRIKRTGTEDPEPGANHYRGGLKKSGYSNLSDVLRTLAANGRAGRGRAS